MNLLRKKNKTHLLALAESTSLHIKKMIQPIFLEEGLKERKVVKGLPSVFVETEKSILNQIEDDCKNGVEQFILFLVPQEKSESEFSADFYSRSIQMIKQRFPHIFLWVDTCLCSINPSGHCCHFLETGAIDLVKTIERLTSLSYLFVSAGADGIAPSDMMDGRILAIRSLLDKTSFQQIPILSYSTKFKSHFYGPFRGAANSAPSFGDRSAYQLDVKDREAALFASLRDAKEGADFLMVKPGMSSIDLIQDIKEKTLLPTGAYQVSGEYASLFYLSENHFLHFELGLLETWNVFSRAGASFLVTYGARLAKRIFG